MDTAVIVLSSPPLSQCTPCPLIPQCPVLSSPRPLSLRGFQVMTGFLVHPALRPVHSSPGFRRPTTPSPRHGAPTSVTACGTTWTLMRPLLRHARSTYACKTSVSSHTSCRNSDSQMVCFLNVSSCCCLVAPA